MSAEIARRDASSFDAIRRTRADGSEYWLARDLCKLVEYETWRNFAAAVDRAKIAAKNSGADVSREFVQVGQLVDVGNLGKQEREDFELSRFAAYLTVMNGDPRKPAIASAQAYFAIRTHQAERIERAVDVIELSTRRLQLIQAARGLIDEGHLETKARLVLARGLGEAPELDEATTPLYAQTFLEEKGLSRQRIKAVSGPFGKRVKAAYILEHGVEPKQYPLETANGQVRPVNAYTESDRALMEDIWTRYYSAGESA
ncbi:phage antirepressor [Nocardia sp. NPDC051463]|uniref:phage antirepressor n=1 Tax=Nocardia sp. NPDC051463 TaxID=3154845 RepID=UPI00344B53C5